MLGKSCDQQLIRIFLLFQTYLHRTLTDDFGCIQYSLKAAEIPACDGAPTVVLAAVLIHDALLAQDTASSGRVAKVKASEKGLESLCGLTVDDFRRKYHCTCSRNTTGGESSSLATGEMGCAI